MISRAVIFLNLFCLFLRAAGVGDVISTDGTIHFDRNADGVAELTLNQTGLGIGVTPSSNLEVLGNALISDRLTIGGALGSSTLHVNGTWSIAPSFVSTNTVLSANTMVMVSPSNASGNIKLVLPTSASVNGQIYQIKSLSNDHGLKIVPQAGEQIDLYSFLEFSSNVTTKPSVELLSTGNHWYVLSQTGDDDLNFVPSSLSNLQMWLDADDAQTLYSTYPSTLAGNGDLVERWVDKSGQGNDATQNNDAEKAMRLGQAVQDTYRTSLFFDSGEGMLTTCDIASPPYTIFTVYNRKTESGGFARAIQGLVNNWLLGPYNGEHLHYAGGWVTVNGDSIRLTENAVTCALNDGANSTFFLNGSDNTETNTPVGAPGIIAMGNAGRWDQSLQGDLSEVIVYNRALSNDEISTVNDYLKSKWQDASDEPDLVCWLDASDTSTVYSSYPTTLAGNGDAVTYWTDKSGHGHHAYDATNVDYYTNVQNGNAVVRLGGSNGDGMVIANDFNLLAYTIFVIFNTSDDSSQSRRALAAIDENWLIGPYQTTVRAYSRDHWVSSGNVSVSANTYYLGVSAADEISEKFYIDGNNETDDDSPLLGITNFALGGKGKFPNEDLDGDIAELRIYNYKMSDAERQAIEAELNTKWGL